MTNISSLIHKEISLFIIYSLIASSVFLPPDFSHAQTRSIVGISHPNKVIILTFGDAHKSQFTNAKPILDKYGFKGSFFVNCLWSSNSRLTWQDISALQRDGQDIESKAMTHRRMTHLSPSDLNYEIAGSKKCLTNHGINTTVIATTHGHERNNGTFINEIAKYYDLAINGFDKLTFLHCNGYAKYSNQTDCRTYFNNGTLTFVNRYSIREWSHNDIDKSDSYNDSKTFNLFVDEVNIQDKYNKVGSPVLAVPIVGYHSIDNNKIRDSTSISLFAQEMKYLHDNGFRVLTVRDLGYDTKNNFLYFKPPVAELTDYRHAADAIHIIL
jgi:biotin operon repressor